MLDRAHTCCFTGHRPEKLPWGSDERDPRCLRLKSRIMDTVEAVYREGYRHFICGMARGCDLYCGEAVLAFRESHPDVILEAAIPCASQCRNWPMAEHRRWQRLVDEADLETMIQEEYTRGCMHRRNRYMVDHSSLVIAVYDGSAGGTRSTLEYAISRRVSFMDLQIEG